MAQSEGVRGYRARAQEWLEAARALPAPEPASLSAAQLAGMIDHTLLKADATPDKVTQLCMEARKYNFASVCINPSYVKLCADLLQGSPVKVCCVVGFPLGATIPEVKVIETRMAIENGASEIDMVINRCFVKAGRWDDVASEIALISDGIHAKGALLKVIIETCDLTEDEKIRMCKIVSESGADFIKTSTGFGAAGATAEDIALMRRECDADVRIKAAGGIRSQEAAQQMLDNGAVRIGASKL